MKVTALRVDVCCASLIFFAVGFASCSGVDTSKKDASGTDEGVPGDASDSSRDVSSQGPDTRDLGPVTDARDFGPAVDMPMAGLTEAGPASGVDAELGEVAGEAGLDVPQLYPDGGPACGLAGASCRSAADCCGLGCVSGKCAAVACLSDGTSCASGGQCCSTICGAGGTCSPLNTTCKTAGNACMSGAECCNGTCNASHQCASPGEVSYCSQVGDICRADGECCTGVCIVAAGALAGTCAIISTSCQIDGTVCDGCGSCCSHFCGPYGAGGPKICQPASGCHVQGDLCRQDSDCCGGDVTSGLPGAGLIKCELDPVYGSRIGTCGGPRASNCPNGTPTCKNSCNPEGDICHFTDTAVCQGATTSKRDDCCACISSKECCQLDPTGIPRCNALAACVLVGGNCSFSGECCNHAPCLPDPATGRLTCGSTCARLGEECTTNGDCCTGMLCQVSPGSLAGTCFIPPPPLVPDAGVPEPDAGVPEVGGTDAAPPICAYYGQACSVSTPCCAGTSCVNGSFAACTAADIDCVCFSPE
jgi:hypothetical protein